MGVGDGYRTVDRDIWSGSDKIEVREREGDGRAGGRTEGM